MVVIRLSSPKELCTMRQFTLLILPHTNLLLGVGMLQRGQTSGCTVLIKITICQIITMPYWEQLRLISIVHGEKCSQLLRGSYYSAQLHMLNFDTRHT